MAQTFDLTTGSLALHFRRLAVPAAIGMVFTTLYNVVDVFFAGLIGTAAQAGLAISFQAFFLFITFGFGLGAAMTALVGNAIGAGARDEARLVAARGIGFGLIITGVLMVLAWFLGPELIKIVSTEGDYREAGTRYFIVLILAIPGFIMSFGINGLLQSQGDTVSMQRAQIAAFFANIVLNPVLVFGIPGLWDGIGFNGIAISTVLSQTGVMVYVGFRLMRTDLMIGLTRSCFRPATATYVEIAMQMLPVTMTMFVMMSAGFIVQFYLKSFGTSAVAAYGVALRVEQLFLLPVFGLTGALLPIAAQNFGAGNHDRVRQALFDCWKFGWMFMAVACPILYFASPLLMRSFTDDPEVIAIGVSYLRIDGFILPIYMMLFAINSFLQALKRPIWTFWIGVYRQAFGVAFFVYVYVMLFGSGVIGVWFGIATAVVSGWLISLVVAEAVARPTIGGLWRRREATG
ncbi:MAG: MATE family efflux transporter [Candidatus Puniceispirillum sp. TMED245]|nr:MAG: MATE family efflux transporter [Candidatus Puniceispirillum sp. TMED245]